MGVVEKIVELTNGTITLGLTLVIVATFLSAFRDTLAPTLQNTQSFPNGVTALAIYDLVILVFVGVGILALLLTVKETVTDFRRQIGGQ